MMILLKCLTTLLLEIDSGAIVKLVITLDFLFVSWYY